LKILFFIDNLGFGGKERRVLELLRYLDTMSEMEIHLVLAKDQIVYKDIFNTKVKIHYSVREGMKKDPRVFFKFFGIVRKIKPHIIHVWGNIEAIYSLPAKLFYSIPLINSQIADVPTDPFHPVLNPKLTFPFADRITGNSHAGLIAYNAPKEKSRVIYNGFDFERIANLSDPDQIKKDHGFQGCFIAGMVASFAKRKDYKSFMMAINELVELEENLKFICIGDGDFKKFRSMLTEKGKERTVFLGHQENVESIMNICDIGILTTKTEGIPNSILEFMALEKPVVVAGGGGCVELVDDKVNGYLLTSGDVSGLVSSILDLKKDEAKRLTFGKASRKIVEDKFSIRKMIDQYLDEYEQLAQKA
jgi:glycosyltransferase involved in cell wall biosynthesis